MSGWVRRRAKVAVGLLARLFGPSRERLFVDLAYSAVTFLRGRQVQRPLNQSRLLVEPIDPEMSWPEPPGYEHGVLRELAHPGAAPVDYDIQLFEELNAAYRRAPLVPNPPSYAVDARNAAAIGRVRSAHRQIDVKEKTVLEVGCSEGHLVWFLGNALGCDAHGVDVVERKSWRSFAGDNVHFELADLAVDNPYEDDTFDRVLSYAVWEHVAHPFEMLSQTFRILKPGGLALITANLHAGPKASHRYREIYFPWPHLLFSDEIIREWDTRNGRPPRGASWVNRLSWDQYRNYFEELGFLIHKVTFRETPIDEAMYRRFENVLGRYPRRDLERDFFTVILEKPATPNLGIRQA